MWSLHLPTPQTRLRPFKPIQFGRYTLLMPLATGGMGEIFLARLEGVQGFEKQCVIKKILPHLTQEEDFVSRFVNEAKTLVQLQHGSIAQVLDMGLHEGEPYLALEFVDGKDLRKVAARANERSMPLPLTFVLYTLARVLDALAYAHRKRDEDEKEIGLVHRDVSPQNVLISYEGEVKVIDFGLAKSTLNVARTNPSIVLGKFLYMSPEQARHTKVDRRTDLYSVGLVLYELVAGKNPFEDVPANELLARVSNPNIPNIQDVEPLCPGPVAQTVMKALAVDPAQRYQTAEEFRGRLMSVLVDIDPAAGPESCSRFMREAFAVEYSSERKLLASLREQRLAAALVVRELEPTRAASLSPLSHELTPMPTDPRKLKGLPELPELPRPGSLRVRMSERPTSPGGGLSFVPTLRLKEDDGRPPPTDRETMPSINLLLSAPPSAFDANGEPVTTRAMVSMPDEAPIPTLQPSTPWPSSETTTPAGIAFEAPRVELGGLPAVMTSVPSQTFEPARVPVVMEGRRASLPARSVTAPLPQALKNKPPPVVDRAEESTGATSTGRSGFMWVVIPLIALLAVAGFVLYDLNQDQAQKTMQEQERNQKPMGTSSTDDRRSREVKPQPPNDAEPLESAPPPEIAIDPPAFPGREVAPEAHPLPPVDGELAPLTAPNTSAPARAPGKRKVRQH